MLDFLIELLKDNASEIGTALVTAIVALLKRLFDKKRIRTRMKEKGLKPEEYGV